jgi:hypothetical protein
LNGGGALFEQQKCPFDRNPETVLDGRSQVSIIRPTSGAVETENSLVNNELRSFDGQLLQVIEAQKKLKKRC